MRRTRRYWPPTSSVAEPRPILLAAVRDFVRAARDCEGVLRIAMVGSLTTAKPMPKDADLLVWIESGLDLRPLATIGRRLKGKANGISLGADIFLANEDDTYLGRTCRYRECHPRAACEGLSCHLGLHLYDEQGVFALPRKLIASPPLDLWPEVVRRQPMPDDVETVLLAGLSGERTAPGE